MLGRTLLALVLATASPAARAEGPCDGEPFSDRIKASEIDAVALESGRVLRLADIRIASEQQALGLLAARAGAAIVGIAGRTPDRWGRLPARIVLAEGGADLAGLLVAEGVAMVDPGDEDDLCRPALLAAEDEARRAKRGIWTSEDVLAADDPAALAQKAGSFVLVEGRIVSVGERTRWTYLNFGRDFARDFAVSIPRRRWERMKAAGLGAGALTGRRVRVRGILDMRRAPAMEIASADVIERLDAEAGAEPDGAGGRRRRR